MLYENIIVNVGLRYEYYIYIKVMHYVAYNYYKHEIFLKRFFAKFHPAKITAYMAVVF